MITAARNEESTLAELLSRRERIAARPEFVRVDLDLVEESRRAFDDVLAAGARDERRQFARLFVKKMEFEPDTGDVLTHLFARPPLPASKQTPASKETGVRSSW